MNKPHCQYLVKFSSAHTQTHTPDQVLYRNTEVVWNYSPFIPNYFQPLIAGVYEMLKVDVHVVLLYHRVMVWPDLSNACTVSMLKSCRWLSDSCLYEMSCVLTAR